MRLSLQPIRLTGRFPTAMFAGLLAVVVAVGGPAVVHAQNEAAPQDEDAPQNNERSSQVRLSTDGLLVGQLGVLNPGGGEFVPVRDIEIWFGQNGRIVQSVRPGPQGVFQVPLDPGVYGLIAIGREGFSAFGLHVLPNDEEDLTAAVQVLGTIIPARDVPLTATLAAYRIAGLDLPDITYNPDLVRLQNGPKVTTLRHHIARLRANGDLVGRLQTLNPASGEPIEVDNADIYFIQDGQILDRTISVEDGSFVARRLRPGVYSLVCVSERTFAGFSVQVLPAIEAAVVDRGGAAAVRFVKFQPGADLDLLATGVDETNLNLVRDALQGDEEGTTGTGGTGPGSGYGGSGVAPGANLSGWLLGGLLGGALGWYLADDDDDEDKGMASPPAP